MDNRADRLGDQQSARLQHGVDLTGDPVAVVRSSGVDDQINQPSEGRPEVPWIGKLLLQTRKLNQQAIELDLFTVAAMELGHEHVVGNNQGLQEMDRMTSQIGRGQRYAGRTVLQLTAMDVVQ
jgi:hypothetical protein